LCHAQVIMKQSKGCFVMIFKQYKLEFGCLKIYLEICGFLQILKIGVRRMKKLSSLIKSNKIECVKSGKDALNLAKNH
jgi:hypothetical protein